MSSAVDSAILISPNEEIKEPEKIGADEKKADETLKSVQKDTVETVTAKKPPVDLTDAIAKIWAELQELRKFRQDVLDKKLIPGDATNNTNTSGSKIEKTSDNTANSEVSSEKDVEKTTPKPEDGKPGAEKDSELPKDDIECVVKTFNLEEFDKIQREWVTYKINKRPLIELLCTGKSHGDPDAIEAIRICSMGLYEAIQRAVDPNGEIMISTPGCNANQTPYTFWHPFHVLVDTFPELEKVLVEYKADHEKMEEGEDREASAVEIAEVELFIDFMKTNPAMQRDFQIKKQIADGTLERISFDKLCYLFAPKTIVVSNERDMQAYRVIGTNGGRHTSKFFDNEKTKGLRSLQSYKHISPFRIHTFTLDFNGTEIGGMDYHFTIQRYEGSLPLHELRVFPFIFLDDAKKEKIRSRGARFRDYVRAQAEGKVTHKHYAALTLVHIGNAYQEEIDSKVIIDHELALQYEPSWRHPYFLAEQEERDPEELASSAVASDSSEPMRNKNCPYYSNCSCDLAYTWLRLRNNKNLMESRSLIFKLFSPRATRLVDAVANLTEDLYVLFPRRVFGFVLRSRKWHHLDITELEDALQDKTSFERLVLPEGHRRIVESLVEMQSRQPQYRANIADVSPAFQMDLIRGKGKGLIILLHGAPGVGKTSTAETVADCAGRPLFPITCGDIGYNLSVLEQNLETNFRLAHKWKCVLLLDEADVFLTKRDKSDLMRNSLVSIFLRVLEYYPGILFLTTNRVGIFDDAFKSRIHICLYYPPLNEQATLEVWKLNIQRIKELKKGYVVKEKDILEFARKNFGKLKWNGRQIRNAFQSAVALAEFKALNGKKKRLEPRVSKVPKLTKHEFIRVAEVSTEFEQYMDEIYGKKEDERAAGEKYRAPVRPKEQANDKETFKGFEDDSEDSDSDSESEEEEDESAESTDSEAERKKRRKARKKKEERKKEEKKKSRSSKSSSSKKTKDDDRKKRSKKRVEESEESSEGSSEEEDEDESDAIPSKRSSSKKTKDAEKKKKGKKKADESEASSAGTTGDEEDGASDASNSKK